MKYLSLLFLSSSISVTAFSQIPEDALKFSWTNPYGTARNQAIGGAAGSLGGDISSLFINPAGLGFYKTGELVLSPGLSMLKNKGSYYGTSASDNKTAFNLGTSGFVFGFNNGTPNGSGAFSIGVTRTANFNSNISYKGQNNFSSYGEQYAAEAASTGMSLNDILNSSSVSLQTRMAVYTYLVDSATIPGHVGQDLISMSMWNNLKKGAPFLVNQENHVETSGGVTDIAIGYASNSNDKLYIGGSLGFPIVNYEKQSTFTETDATNNPNSNFASSELKETYTTRGMGVNLKMGVIYKPADFIRLGLAIHSPTVYGLKDTYQATMTTNTENYPPSPGLVTVSSNTFTGSPAPAEYKYDLTSPWRAMLSASYVISEVADVTKQRGFLTADIEYVNYKSNSYKTGEDDNDNTYYDGVNKAIKDYYKSAFNFRVGGELKFTTIMARLGFAYYGNPYKDSELNGHKMYASGGLGYRNKGIFVDLTYVLAMNKDINLPYRLSDKQNRFATIDGTGGNIALTLGCKF